jgi:hypothetical protein
MVQVDSKREIKSRSLETLREKWKIKVIMDIKSLTTLISPNNMKFWLEFKRQYIQHTFVYQRLFSFVSLIIS